MTESPTIRPYRPADRPALDDICVRTARNGQDSRPFYADPGIFPDTFAAPYAHLEPELAFVLDDGAGRAVGYILGTADTVRFAAAFREVWLPLVAHRYPEPTGSPDTPDGAIARLLHHPERMVVPELAAWPAHLHIDLLPEWQGRGYGRRLMRTFLAALRDGGVPAVHLVMATANRPARAFYDRMGFEEIDAPVDDSVVCLGRTTGDLDRL
ncbi:GNAT family N-acetyltransferase [Streptomyces capillispiralis]|uniref:Acetyltransferase (GNAT) family protein n=1 Tax=Streptomyces capillispiralis TaxID=68182 RepID=A0A561TRB1_9ACTN|nr:GNAT family N-acetyltransferase [Streptomyces capillispiralis]TWF89637.1 acetyltransferase (GNAT) family protein [Streptomyces capillispiralis]GHH93956.1 acetyltransferase [Streptomyces capillispiralis]